MSSESHDSSSEEVSAMELIQIQLSKLSDRVSRQDVNLAGLKEEVVIIRRQKDALLEIVKSWEETIEANLKDDHERHKKLMIRVARLEHPTVEQAIIGQVTRDGYQLAEKIGQLFIGTNK